jgi:hypothetical protein
MEYFFILSVVLGWTLWMIIFVLALEFVQVRFGVNSNKKRKYSYLFSFQFFIKIFYLN